MKENENTTCDPCERDFEKSIEELVKEGKAPSHAERKEKEHEVNAAFVQQHPAEHSGKQCNSSHAAGHASSEQGGQERPAQQTSGMASACGANPGSETTGGMESSEDRHPGQQSGMQSTNAERSGMNSSAGEQAGRQSRMGSSDAGQSGAHTRMSDRPGDRTDLEDEERKTHESADSAVHAMAGSASDWK